MGYPRICICGDSSVFTSAQLPDGIEEDLARNIIRDIAQAPGKDMSSIDRLSLGLKT